MKNLILILLFLVVGCKPKYQDTPVMKSDTQTEILTRLNSTQENLDRCMESVNKASLVIDSLNKLKVVKNETENLDQKKIIDSLKVINNKLGKELLHNKLIIQNAKYYLNIANKNPSQQKFLRGWMNRALNQ